MNIVCTDIFSVLPPPPSSLHTHWGEIVYERKIAKIKKRRNETLNTAFDLN